MNAWLLFCDDLSGAHVASSYTCARHHLQAIIQENYNRTAIHLSLLVATLYTAVGAFRLGFITNFLSHSVGRRACDW